MGKRVNESNSLFLSLSQLGYADTAEARIITNLSPRAKPPMTNPFRDFIA